MQTSFWPNGFSFSKQTKLKMPNLKPTHFNISKGLFSTEIWRPKVTTFATTSYIISYINPNDVRRKWKRKTTLRTNLQSIRSRRYATVIRCCNVVSASPSSATAEDVDKSEDLNEKYENKKGEFGNLISEYGWQVRRMVAKDSEMRMVAQVQAEAFYEPLFLFNDLFFEFFKAEVLQGLIYRLRSSASDRYACLVAQPSGESGENIVGVVDVTFLRDADVLHHLPGEDEYLYISGIAVLNNFRRQKVASALLKACDMLADLWGSSYLVLRAYEDDIGARKLYTNAGFSVASGDPPWTTTWIGRKRRILMIKKM